MHNLYVLAQFAMPLCQVPRDLPLIEEDEADTLIYHHYYLQPSYPGGPQHPSGLYRPDPSATASSQPPADR